MKKILFILTGMFMLMGFVASSAGVKDIISALKKGDATEVSKHFDSFVDIKLPNKEEVKNVSKNQATVTLKDFYSEQNISGFELISQREMGGTGYLAGKLKSDSHEYNITLMVKTKNNDTSIVSVRIN
ncbi:MAG TPA: DUF4783 domain-containing protein [Arachidicoccus soli]|nr:DUF4783 domain-containing protein [Arachidicoccus soli]